MLSLRLFLPESWTSDAPRMDKAGVPAPFREYRTKPEIAIEEIDRVIAAGVRFNCVLADSGYGLSASFRLPLSVRGLCWAVGIPRHQMVYPADVQPIFRRWVSGGRVSGTGWPSNSGCMRYYSKMRSGGRTAGVGERRGAWLRVLEHLSRPPQTQCSRCGCSLGASLINLSPKYLQ